MSDSIKRDARNLPQPTFSHCSPYGNMTALLFSMATVAGVMVEGSLKTALAIGDVAVLGVLPSGMRLCDSMSVISAAFTAATTMKVGFRYIDGVDDANVPQADDYFATGMVADAAARLRNATSNAIVILPKPAYLIVTLAGAAQAATSKIEVLVIGELTGIDE